MGTTSRKKSELKRGSQQADAHCNLLFASPPRALVHGLIPAAIAVITFIAFVPALQNGFVNWDDDSHLLNNPHYRGLGWPQLRWMFTTCFNGSCMPLNWVTYGMDYLLWGMKPGGYHFTSLIIHAVNGALFYYLSVRLLSLAGKTPVNLPIALAAAFSALFFSLHPLQVEAAVWILGREIAIAGFFFISTLLCYLKAAESRAAGLPSCKWIVAACVLYALSLLGKEAALTLPFALFVLDVYPLKRLGGGPGRWFGPQVRHVWWEKIPFLLLAVAAGIRAILEKQSAGSLYPVTEYGLAPRIAQVLYSLTFYPGKTLFPTSLSPLYPLHPFTGIWELPVLFNAAVVCSLTAGLFIARRRWPAGLAAWIFYGILLIPVSGVVAFGPYRAADRFSYLPSLAWAVLAGAAFYYCWQLWLAGRLRSRALIFTQSVAVFLLVALGTLSWRQSKVWHNSEGLWKHALALEEKSSFAHNNLGLALAERGAIEQAIPEFRRAVEIDPVFAEAHANLGHFLILQGSSQEGVAHLRQALKIEPAFANAHNTLGNFLADRGDVTEAIRHFHSALKVNPDSAMTHYNLARSLARQGDPDNAIVHYRRALELDPRDADIYNNLGLLLVSKGNLEESITHFQRAVQVNPTYAKAYFNLGKVYAGQDRLDDAVASFQKASSLAPNVPEIHENLARVLARQGKGNEAIQEYQKAVSLLRERPNKPAR